MTDRHSTDESPPPLTLFQLMGSVLAAMFGVQTNERRARDFSRGKLSHFVMIGFLFTALFVLAVWGVVKLVIGLAAP